CIAVVAYDVVANRRAMVQEVETLAGMVGENSTAALTFRDLQAAQQVLSALRADPNILAACIYSAAGEPFAHYARQGIEHVCPARPGPEGHYFTDRELVQFRHVTLAGEFLGTVYIALDLKEFRSHLQRYA
ncbi:MAG TPA: CHASE sensor domain-containing protein, partial [Terriglobales bacterium]|nr:CHASE sensor domain-containing protein [Terriglobales bacterium]